MPPRGMCKHRDCDCHCEEAAAAAKQSPAMRVMATLEIASLRLAMTG